MTRIDERSKFIKTLSEIPHVRRACKIVGVDHSTFYRWKKDNLDFKKSVEVAQKAGRDYMTENVERALYKNAVEKGDPASQRFWLENNDPRYMKKRTVYVKPIQEKMPPPKPGESCVTCRNHKPTEKQKADITDCFKRHGFDLEKMEKEVREQK